MIKRILVATDGSDHAAHAIKYAVESADKWDAKLIIISVIPPIKPIIPELDGFHLEPTPEFENELEEAYTKVLDETAKKIQKKNPTSTLKNAWRKVVLRI